MAETKEEKVARLAREAEGISNAQSSADNESDLKQTDESEVPKDTEADTSSKEDAAETAEAAEAAGTIPSHLQEVALNDESPSVVTNVHTIYHAKGSTEFVDGVANVSADVAAHLKESGQVK